jgi:hypothetical protein
MASTALLFASAASALVLPDKSPEQKLRKDITKQLSKYTACLGKALSQCEKGTDPFTAECSLATGVVIPPGDPKIRFVADLTKCVSKVDLMKKAKVSSVEAAESIGCSGGFADLEDYEDERIGTLKVTLDQLGLLRNAAINGCDVSCAGEPSHKIGKCEGKCVDDIVKRFTKMTLGMAKCLEKCENDYKDKKGNGGPTDLGNCEVAQTLGDQDANFFACTEKVFEKAEKKAAWPTGIAGILPIVIGSLNDGNDAGYNSPDACL